MGKTLATDDVDLDKDVQDNPDEGGGAGGNGDEKVEPLKPWMGQLPKELKQDETLAKFDNLETFGKAYKALDEKLSQVVTVPDDNTTDEERAAFFTKTGRPEAADGYELKDPDLPGGMQIPAELKKGFQDKAYEIGLSKRQAGVLYNWFNGQNIDAFKASAAEADKAKEKGRAVLQAEWGADFQENYNLMRRAVAAFGTQEFTDYLEQSGFGNNPMIARVFYGVGKAIGEDKLLEGEAKGKPTKATPGQLSYPSMD